MTFEDPQPVYRGDEDSARFAGRRYDRRAPDWRAYRFSVFGPCLEGDSVPYLRSLWHLGWLAVCPIHGTVLLIRFERCHYGIRVPHLSVYPILPDDMYPMWRKLDRLSLSDGEPRSHPSAVAPLKGKYKGSTEIAGLGTFTWQELAALVDVILGGFWTATILEERESILLRYQFETIETPPGYASV